MAMGGDCIGENLLEVRSHTGAGFLPLVDFEHWRVAVLNFNEDLRPQALSAMQRHDLTDEVFVLLRGSCLLFVGEGGDGVGAIHARDLKPLTIYNVRRGTWHTHALTENAMVLVVENRVTTYANSPFHPLDEKQRGRILDLTRTLWGGGSESRTRS